MNQDVEGLLHVALLMGGSAIVISIIVYFFGAMAMGIIGVLLLLGIVFGASRIEKNKEKKK